MTTGLSHLADRLLLRLRQAAVLTPREEQELRSLVDPVARTAPMAIDLASVGDKPSAVRVILDGFACRYRILEDGRRQILGFALPGDFCDLSAALLGIADYSVTTVSDCVAADVNWHQLRAAADQFSGIARALAWSTLMENAVLQEWLVNLGQRLTEVRMAHLFCELVCRLKVVGCATQAGSRLPLTQKDLGDALGVSTVHVNRVLQMLRGAGLVRLSGGRLEIPDFAALAAYAHFTPHYLHLGEEALSGMGL